MFDLMYSGCALLIGGTLVSKVRALRSTRTAMLVATILCHAFVALAFLAATPTVYELIGRATGIPNLATLVVYGCITCFAACAQALALLWTTRAADPVEVWSLAGPRIRRRVAVVGVLLAVMVALFTYAAATDGLPGPAHPLDFDTTYAASRPITAFLLVYQANFAFALLAISIACWRHADQLAASEPNRVALRTGVRLIATGCHVALGYVLCKVVAILAAASGNTGWDELSTVAGPLFASIGSILMAAGFFLPAVQLWRQQRQDFLVLRPLWLAAAMADSNVLLDPVPPTWRHLLATRDLQWRLARCVAEIRDAQLAMRVWRDPWIAETAAALAREDGLPEDDVTAASEAAALLGAIQARRRELDRIAHNFADRRLPLAMVTEAVSDAVARGLPGHAPAAHPHGPAVDDPGTPVDQRAEREHLVRIANAIDTRPVTEALELAARRLDRREP